MNERDLDAAIRRFNLAAYLSRLHLPFRTTATGEYCFTCPRCHRDKLYANSRTKLFMCQRCPDFRGTLVTLVEALSGRSRFQAVQEILSFSAYAASAPVTLVESKDCALPPHFHPLAEPRDPKQQPYWRYFLGRGFDAHLVSAYRIGYCRVGDYAGRLVIPVLREGTLVSWVARDITGTASRKVYTPTGNQQGRCLFNLDAVAGGGTAVLCEGVFDALRLPSLCVATFGKRLSDEQRLLLQRSKVSRVIIAWDQDARREALLTALRIGLSFDEVRVAELSGHDPADMSEDELRACLDAAGRVTKIDLMREELKGFLT